MEWSCLGSLIILKWRKRWDQKTDWPCNCWMNSYEVTVSTPCFLTQLQQTQPYIATGLIDTVTRVYLWLIVINKTIQQRINGSSSTSRTDSCSLCKCSNPGQTPAVCVNVQTHLDKEMLWLDCRHNISSKSFGTGEEEKLLCFVIFVSLVHIAW